MASYYSGVGGSVSFLYLDASYDPVDVVTLDVTSWSVQDAATPADLTNASASGSRCGTKGYTVSWSLSLPVAAGGEPESLRLQAGNPTWLWFRVGEEPIWHRLENTMVVQTSPVLSAVGDVLRMTVTGMGGDIFYYTATAPAVPSAPVSPPGYVGGGTLSGLSTLGGTPPAFPPGVP